MQSKQELMQKEQEVIQAMEAAEAANVRAEKAVNSVIELVRDGYISVEQAADKLGKTTEEIRVLSDRL